MWNRLDYGDLATWIGSVATAAALFFAFYQLARDRKDRRSERAEVTDKEERKQAELISGWFQNDFIVLNNASDQPAYRAVVFLVLIQGTGPQTGEEVMRNEHLADYCKVLGVMPPGRSWLAAPEGWGGMSRRPGIEMGFIDAAGKSWIRRATGLLEAIKSGPIEHYEIDLPVEFVTPEGGEPPVR
jgi:hypothetical protein